MNKERRQSLENTTTNPAIYKVSHVFSLCMFASLWSRWTATSKTPLYCRVSVSPPSWGQRFDFQTGTDKITTFFFFPVLKKKPSRHFGDKKAISATWPQCWVDWFERREVSQSGQDSWGLFSRQWQISLCDFHFQKQYRGNVFSHKADQCLP